MPDTSTPAVMHLVGMLPDWRNYDIPEGLHDALLEAAETLKALVMERDKLLAERK